MRRFSKTDKFELAIAALGIAVVLFLFVTTAKGNGIRVQLGHSEYEPLRAPDNALLCIPDSTNKHLDCWPLPLGTMILIPAPVDHPLPKDEM